jgi:hypothetical protein
LRGISGDGPVAKIPEKRKLDRPLQVLAAHPVRKFSRTSK